MKIEEISWESELDLDVVEPSVLQALNTKKLFRYQYKKAESAVNKLEDLVGRYVGTQYSLATSSATNAIFLALKSVGVNANSKVLIPAFTFTAVPSAVLQCGAEPVLVEITENYVIDLNDLKQKIFLSGAKFLLLSHMRGHLCNMDEVVSICNDNSIILIEDAAHALGVKWNGKHAGTFGSAGVYSLQSYKIINAGEGGLLVTNDPDIYWKSVFMSGSYEKNYLSHSSDAHDIAEKYINKLPVFNVRMNVLTASIAIPQLMKIEETITHVNANYSKFKSNVSPNKLIQFPEENIKVRPVRDSAQIRIKMNTENLIKLKSKLNNASMPISFFGGKDNTNARLYQNWKFLNSENISLPNTDRNLSQVFDVRLPIHFSSKEISAISDLILSELSDI